MAYEIRSNSNLKQINENKTELRTKFMKDKNVLDIRKCKAKLRNTGKTPPTCQTTTLNNNLYDSIIVNKSIHNIQSYKKYL